MSPTFLKIKNYRFYVNSREEARIHIHVQTPDGEAKIWLEPEIELFNNYGIREAHLSEIIEIVKEKKDEFIQRWKSHFNV